MTLPSTASRIWKSAQLFIGFHRDPDRSECDEPKLWPPKKARAKILAAADLQETFAVVRGAKEEDDVQIKMRANKIILRRDQETAWHGVIADAHAVSVVSGDTAVTINTGVLSLEGILMIPPISVPSDRS